VTAPPIRCQSDYLSQPDTDLALNGLAGFIFPAAENRGHDAGAAMAVKSRHYPQGLAAGA